ncbi:hypothetical protein SK128_007601 [Halocaridina rubra]|uniref:Uncharacterized protein n=1 Tax=Halocaridina rubra TaxID=373956 RepID=A0AAN8WBN4_HALRR
MKIFQVFLTLIILLLGTAVTAPPPWDSCYLPVVEDKYKEVCPDGTCRHSCLVGETESGSCGQTCFCCVKGTADNCSHSFCPGILDGERKVRFGEGKCKRSCSNGELTGNTCGSDGTCTCCYTGIFPWK